MTLSRFMLGLVLTVVYTIFALVVISALKAVYNAGRRFARRFKNQKNFDQMFPSEESA